jgi:hypothetical protein
MNHAYITVVLGDEFDDALRAKLVGVLRSFGVVVASPESRATGGSQELEELDVIVDGQRLHIEAETYVGLSIGGPSDLVKRIQRVMLEQ